MDGFTSSDSDARLIGGRTTARLLAVLAAALVLRGTLLWLRGSYLDWDEAMYLLLARSLLEGQGPMLNGLPHTALGPFVPAVTATISRLSGLELLAAQRLASAVLGALTLIPVWYLLRTCAGQRIAWTAVALLVAWPALVDVAPKPGPMWFHMYAGSEPTFLFFLFASVACAEAALRAEGALVWAWSGLAGAGLAFAYLGRAEAVVFGGLYVLVRGIQWVHGRGGRRGLYALASVAFGFLVFAGPHLYYLHRVTDSWILSGQTAVMGPTAETLQEAFRDDRHLENFVRTWYRLDAGHTHYLNPYWGTPVGVSPELQREQFAQLASIESPTSRSWLLRIANRLSNYAYMLWVLAGPVFLPFVILGIVVSRKRVLPAFALAGFAASLVTSLYLAVLPRFYLYLVPVFALWAAYGIAQLADRFRVPRISTDRVLASGLVVLSIAMVGRRALGRTAAALTELSDSDRSVSESLAMALPLDEPVMHWHPRFAYWGGWPWRTMPIASLDAVAHYASTIGVRYVLVSRGGYAPVRPGVPYFLVILDVELQETLRATNPGGERSHTDPPMVLRAISPVGGYPAALLSLDSGRVE